MQLIMAVVFEGKVFFFLIVGLRFNLWFKKKAGFSFVTQLSQVFS